MALKPGPTCFVRPKRSRVRRYSAKDCGRIVCYALAAGESHEDVFDEVKKCLGDPCETERVRAFLKALLELMVAILAAMALARTISAGVLLLARLAARIPLLRPILARAQASAVLIEDAFTNARDITGQAELLLKTLK